MSKIVPPAPKQSGVMSSWSNVLAGLRAVESVKVSLANAKDEDEKKAWEIVLQKRVADMKPLLVTLNEQVIALLPSPPPPVEAPVVEAPVVEATGPTGPTGPTA